MSLASTYATAVAAQEAALASAQATVPAGFTGPDGLMSAAVNSDGSCQIVANGYTHNIPAALVLAFCTWAQATFT